MKLSRVSLFATMSLAVGLSACSSLTDAPSNAIWKSPSIGTAYLYEGSSTRTTVQDSTTTRTSHGSLSLITERTGQTMGGKANVTTFTSEQGDGLRIAYELNGDFSLGDSSYTGWEWTTYPVGSHATLSSPSFDSVDPYGTRHVSTRMRSYAGQETITLGGRSYVASKVVEATTRLDSSESSSYRTQDFLTIWWVPELKLFGKWSEDLQEWDNMASPNPYYYRMQTNLELVMYGQHTRQQGGGASSK